MYFFFAAIDFHNRNQCSNVLSFTLRPHESNFSDVIAAIQPLLANFDKGQELDIHGKKVFICAFTLAYIGDMPQQQGNSGCMSQRASLRCRFCFVNSHDCKKFDVDLAITGRFHHDTMKMRKQMSTLNKTRAVIYGQKQEFNPAEPPLVSILPALDLFISQPSDPAHSKFNDTMNQMHLLLMNAILTLPA